MAAGMPIHPSWRDTVCGAIEAFLNQWRASGRPLDLPELQRRLARCRACTDFERCPKIEFQQWLSMLVDGGPEQAADLCEKWKI